MYHQKEARVMTDRFYHTLTPLSRNQNMIQDLSDQRRGALDFQGTLDRLAQILFREVQRKAECVGVQMPMDSSTRDVSIRLRG